MKIRQFLFNYLCVHRLFRQAKYMDWNKVSTVLLLYELDNAGKQSVIKGLIHQLFVAGKHVTSIGYCAQDQRPAALSASDLLLGPRDLNLLGQPKSDIWQQVQPKQFDVIIDLTRQPVLPLQYIAMQASASLKVGTRSKPKLYDIVLQISADASVEYIFQQIIHYLQIIKSAD